MTWLRRRPRTVFRVYSEDEYLAGADAADAALADWGMAGADEPRHGRRLQRLAGAAALTTAVGTVGGVVGLARLHARAVGTRETAERLVPSLRTAPRASVSAAATMRPRRARSSGPRRRHTDRGAPTRAARHVPAPVAANTARIIAVSVPPPAPAAVAAVASAARQVASSSSSISHAVTAVATGPRAQSEFGFER